MSVCPGSCESAGCPVWCVSCSVVVGAALRRLPLAYVALEGVLAWRVVGFDDVWVSGSRVRGSVSVGVDVRDELFRWVVGWCEREGMVVPRGVGERVLEVCVDYLGVRLEGLMGSAEFGLGVLRLFDSVLRLVRNGPLRAHVMVPCGWCGRRCLVQREGLGGVPWYTACEQGLGGCGRLFTEREMVWAAQVALLQ